MTSTSYSVNSPASYDNSASFSLNELGYYSIDGERGFYNNDDRELHRLRPGHGSIGSDLGVGFSQYGVDELMKKLNLVGRPLDGFLRWIVLNKQNVPKHEVGGKKRLDADFVMVRGTMKRLLATVFNTGEYKQTWRMYAVKYNGTIYISHVEEAPHVVSGGIREPTLNCRTREEEVRKITYMGLKFEDVVSEPKTQDRAGTPGGAGIGAVVERKGFYSVSRGVFGGRHQILTRSEVDCIENGEYIELKLCLQYSGRDEWRFPMYKLRDWWYHMYAGDMKKIVYGTRDGPRLTCLSSVQRDDIPSQVRHPSMSCPPRIGAALNSWTPGSSVGFVDEFLQWLKGVVVEDSYGGRGAAIQYHLEWKKGGKDVVACTRVNAERCDYPLLPGWFTTEMAAAFQG